MTKARRLNRRQTLKGVAAAALPLVHIRTAGAAGKLSFAMWDHWVPEGNAAFQKAADAWAAKNKVDVKVDFLSSNGEKINIAMAAEARPPAGTTSTRSTNGPCISGPTSWCRWTMWWMP